MKIILFVQFDFFYHWRSRPESASLRPPSWEIWRTPPSGCLDSQPVTWSRRTSGSSLPAASTVSVGNVCLHRVLISWLGKVYSALTLSSNKVQWHESVFSGYVKDDFIFKRYVWIPLFFKCWLVLISFLFITESLNECSLLTCEQKKRKHSDQSDGSEDDLTNLDLDSYLSEEDPDYEVR